MVACCYGRGVYPVRASVPRTASAIRMDHGLRFRRVSSLYNVDLSRVGDLGPRFGGDVVPKRDGPRALHLPVGCVDTFVSGRSAVCTRHDGRLFGGHEIITISGAHSATHDDGNDATAKGIACRGVHDNRGLNDVTQGCNIAIGRLGD